MGENKLASNQFPMCSPQPGTTRQVHGVTWKREVGGGTRRKRGGINGGETNLASNQFPECSPQPRTPREIHRVK